MITALSNIFKSIWYNYSLHCDICCLARVALVEPRFDQLSQQFAAYNLQQLYNVTCTCYIINALDHHWMYPRLHNENLPPLPYFFVKTILVIYKILHIFTKPQTYLQNHTYIYYNFPENSKYFFTTLNIFIKQPISHS